MANEPTFYKRTITYEVLSDDPNINDRSLEDILEACDSGDSVGHIVADKVETMNVEQTREALEEAGSDGSFFQLDDLEDEGPTP